MRQLDASFLRSLADWPADGAPVTSVYLDVDGRRWPRRQDYETRGERLLETLVGRTDAMERGNARSVMADVAKVRDAIGRLDRGTTRGLAFFSCSHAALWEEVRLPRPVPDRARVAAHAHVLPLEALLQTYESFCTVIVDRSRARLFLSRVGAIAEEDDVFDEVPGQHDQGGWSQARYQRHIEELVAQHLKHVGDLLLTYFKRRGFDHLILAGPEEIVPQFERTLHDYLRRRVVARLTLPMTASADEVLARSLTVEESREEQRERRTVERLLAEASAGRQGVLGVPKVLRALNDGRVETLVVPHAFEHAGSRCSDCGRLAATGRRCDTCGGRLEAVADVVEEAVAAALSQSARVETLSFTGIDVLDGQRIGAILRY